MTTVPLCASTGEGSAKPWWVLVRASMLRHGHVHPQWFICWLMTQKTSCCWGSYINIHHHISSYINIYHHISSYIFMIHHDSSCALWQQPMYWGITICQDRSLHGMCTWQVPTGREEAHSTIFGRAEGTVAQRLLPGDVGNMRNDACQPMKGSLLRLGLSNSNNVCVDSHYNIL